MRRRAVPLAALIAALPSPALAQRTGVWFTVEAADSVLSTPGGMVGLEAFRGDEVTGVYLHGDYRGERESVAYGIDPDSQRYVWFSIDRSDSLKHVVMLIDVDLDVTPDFLLFHTIDEADRQEEIVEYVGPAAREASIDIQVQPTCAPPRCDPETWTVRPRARIEVPTEFFDPWRQVLGLAAARGEAWLGKPKSIFLSQAPPGPAP